ncbi:helix-turn-helix domain-containing protein [Streptomyces sp. NPDC048489]|uniref:GlxA family transcriptional regulator n=1 Tax=Streptomyces sp. NPDC048489 TaxID=3154504 RepID=UPI0034286D16
MKRQKLSTLGKFPNCVLARDGFHGVPNASQDFCHFWHNLNNERVGELADFNYGTGHAVAILASNNVVPFELAMAAEIFSRARLSDGIRAYRVRICAPNGAFRTLGLSGRTGWDLGALESAGTIIVPGRLLGAGSMPPEVLHALRQAAAAGARIASLGDSVCVLAEAGLLNGVRATAHRIVATHLVRKYPEVEVTPDLSYVESGQILTSAGSERSLELFLHLIRQDLGMAAAVDAAHTMVVPTRKTGNRAQLVVDRRLALLKGSALVDLLNWAEKNLGRDITLADMAARTGMSSRSFSRHFREQTGTTPVQWLIDARVRLAQYLLENSSYGIDFIARRSGFHSSDAFRDRFRRKIGVSPRAYRKAFRVPLDHLLDPMSQVQADTERRSADL